MHKKIGIILMTMGAVLSLSALLLFGYNRYKDEQAGEMAESILLDLLAFIEKASEETVDFKNEKNTELPVVEIDGYEYIGYLSIPQLELELPVMAEWSYERLKIAPCRELGSSRSDDLVIAAHNYTSHFGRLKELSEGCEVIFTDMDGIADHYFVKEINTTDPYDVETVQNSPFDLVLYTCTIGGKSRITVFCDRK